MWIALTGIGAWSGVMVFVTLLMATIKERHRMEEEAIEDYERRRLWETPLSMESKPFIMEGRGRQSPFD